MQQIFEFAVIYSPLPTKEQADRGEEPKSELVVDLSRTLAGNEREAMMLAARAIPAQYADKLDRLTIAMRPF